MKRLRTFFMGTPDFAVPCLERLVEISDVVGVATQPDKKRGRGQKVTPSPVKIFAQERVACIGLHQRPCVTFATLSWSGADAAVSNGG